MLPITKNMSIQIYIYKISPPKTENIQRKKNHIFHISAQNIDCVYPLEPPRRGASNEYRQSMFLSRNKKNNVYPCKWGLRESILYRHVVVMRFFMFNHIQSIFAEWTFLTL